MKLILTLALILSTSLASQAQPSCLNCSESPTADLQKSCIDSLVSQGYDVSSSDFIDACRRVVNVYSVRAVRKMTESRQEIELATMNALVRVNGPLTFGCVAALIDNGYQLSSAFAEGCLENSSRFSLEAIQLIAKSRQEIELETLSSVARITSFFPDACIGTLVANGYSVSSPFAQACSLFCSESATRALGSIAKSRREITLDEMESLSRIGR